MKALLYIFIGATVLLGYLQIKSCKDPLVSNLQKSNDSLRAAHELNLDEVNHLWYIDSLNSKQYNDTVAKYNHIIDSLTKENISAKLKISNQQELLNHTIDELMATTKGDTTGQTKELMDLRRQLADLADLMHFQNDVGDSKESVYQEQIKYLDSVVSEKDSTISHLRYYYTGISADLDACVLNTDKAIADLKKGKKVNILRTIGEAAIVLFAIFKK